MKFENRSQRDIGLLWFDAAFTLNGFDDQKERNLTYVKTEFQVLKLKFHACNFKQASYPFHKHTILRDLEVRGLNRLRNIFVETHSIQRINILKFSF